MRLCRREQIGKKCLVVVTGEEAGQLTTQPVAEALCEFRIVGIFEAMQDERTEQNLATCVVGAILSGESWLGKSAQRG